MILKVMTSGGLKLSKDVRSVTLPASGGLMQVLPLHAGSVVILKSGRVIYDDSELKIGGGVARISHDEVMVLSSGFRGPLI